MMCLTRIVTDYNAKGAICSCFYDTYDAVFRAKVRPLTIAKGLLGASGLCK